MFNATTDEVKAILEKKGNGPGYDGYDGAWKYAQHSNGVMVFGSCRGETIQVFVEHIKECRDSADSWVSFVRHDVSGWSKNLMPVNCRIDAFVGDYRDRLKKAWEWNHQVPTIGDPQP